MSAALYWAGGVTILLLERITPDGTIHPVIALLAMLCVACSPLLLLGAHFAPNAWWGPHLRILLPLGVLGVGCFVVGDVIGPLALIILLPLMAIAFLHEARVAVPYVALAIGGMTSALVVFDSGDAALTRAVILGGTMAGIATGLIFVQNRLRRAAAANHDLSVTDPLTGLANLRRLQQRLDQEIQRSSRAGHQVVMFAIDLDDFKEVNDRFSYELGDSVLKAVASALATEMEPGDLLVRRGGDEFAVLTLASPGRDLDRFGERLHRAIARARSAICPDVNPEASITQVSHNPGETAEQLLVRVDEGLHESKLVAHPERRGLSEPDRVFAPRERAASTGEHVRLHVAGRAASPATLFADSTDHAAQLRTAWRLVATGVAILAMLTTIVALAGIASDLRTNGVAAALAGLYACAIGAALAGHARVAIGWIHLPLTASLLLVTAVIAQSGASQIALVDLYAVQTPIAVYLLGWRHAWPYAIVSGLLYAYFLLDSNYEYALLQIVMFTGIMALLNTMLARGQRMTRGFLAEAEALSVVDPLTGAANLRGFERRVQDEIGRCELLGEDLALAMIDLEGFKHVNDRYSHSVGDAVLVETAAAIRDTVREDELVVRRGGDEFAIVVVPEAHADMEAFSLRLVQAIERARMELTSNIPVGATVTHVFWQPGENAAAFMRRADEELHEAKRRERVAERS